MIQNEIEQSYEIRRERMCALPPEYMGNLPQESTAPEEDQAFLSPRLNFLSKVPLWKFSTTDMAVISSKPIRVKLSKQENIYYAENEALDVYAYGDSLFEAIEDFCEQVIYFYRHYKNLKPDRVTGEARELKKRYKDLFKEYMV